MKRYTFEQKALVGFEKSGHFFFQPPLGKGYDDGLVAAIAVCDMLERSPGQVAGRSQERAAQDLGLAHHVAALRRRGEVRHRRQDHRPVQGRRRDGQAGGRPEDPRPRHRQRRARRAGGRHLGPGARLLQQARAGDRGGEPDARRPTCAPSSPTSTAASASSPRSASTTRRFDSAASRSECRPSPELVEGRRSPPSVVRQAHHGDWSQLQRRASTCKCPIADGIVGALDGSALQEGRDRIERGQADDGPGERLLHLQRQRPHGRHGFAARAAARRCPGSPARTG